MLSFNKKRDGKDLRTTAEGKMLIEFQLFFFYSMASEELFICLFMYVSIYLFKYHYCYYYY